MAHAALSQLLKPDELHDAESQESTLAQNEMKLAATRTKRGTDG